MPRTVLLADDSVTAQNMGRRILTDAGYEVITVNNGSAALKKIHESRPDLIVLDVYMPGYGGLEVCQRLKESDATMRIPVLLTVGKMEPFKTDEAKRVRADGHIIKPFDASELLAALTKLEDRIVPKESVRGKSDKKKAKLSSGRDPASAEDTSRDDQISYLKQEKQRQAAAVAQKQEQPQEAEVASKSTPASSTESQEPSAHESSGEAVTFASGPIYEPGGWGKVQQKAPEFPVEKQVEPVEQVETLEAGEPAQEAGSEQLPAVEAAATELPAPSSESSTEPGPAEAEPAKVTHAGPRWVAQNVELTAEEASRSLDEEMRQAQAADEPPQNESQYTAASDEPSQPAAVAEQPAPEPLRDEERSSGAAFAAAASASDSSAPVEALAVGPSQSESAPKSEAATAWNEWERIRDSVVNKETTEAIAQSVAAMTQSDAQVQSAQPSQSESQPASQPMTEASDQTGARDPLSTIVDSVLAELKPRLLAEIAKQIAADKK